MDLPVKRNRTEDHKEVLSIYDHFFSNTNLESFSHNLASLKSAKEMIEKNRAVLLNPIPQKKPNLPKPVKISTSQIADFLNVSSAPLLEKVISSITSFTCYIFPVDFFLNIKSRPALENLNIKGKYLIIPILEQGIFSIALIDNDKSSIEYYSYKPETLDRHCEIIENVISANGEKYDWELMELPEFITNNGKMTWVLFALANNLDLNLYSEPEFAEGLYVLIN